ncbi:MAG: hypothetical protein KGD63_09660 [Candidatus Lokiarchaeota archaeon]|nr:hypothetical protein [Candidatus Lokiarchaeota archaeon]
MIELDYDEILSRLENELNAKCAISNKYGIILGSVIKELSKDKIIPQNILELISNRQGIANALKLDKITSFALEAKENNYLFTFSEDFILVSKLGLDVNLAKFMPSIRLFLKSLSAKLKKTERIDFSPFDFSKELNQIKESLEKEKINNEKYSIVKTLIKHMSK